MENEYKKIVEERKKLNKLRNQLYSKQKLETNMEKKIKTTMIGALATFEDYFAELWGYDKPYNKLTEEEQHYRDMWEDVRNDVLNKGNHQSRLALTELQEYDVTWNKHKVEFKIGNDNE